MTDTRRHAWPDSATAVASSASPVATLSPDELQRALNESAAYRALPPAAQHEMSQAMNRVFGFLGNAPATSYASPPYAPAQPFAPDLNALRGGGAPGGNARPAHGGLPAGSAAAPGANGAVPGTPGAPPPGGNAFQRAAGATREMLGAVGFPDFVASLIQGTFRAIVDASIQQMEAYSALLAETSKTIGAFMEDNISDDMARDHLTTNHGDIFHKDMSSGLPKMTVAQGQSGELPSFLRDLGFDSPADLDAQTVDQVVVPNTRLMLAEMRHRSLATMVMMGINRIVVSDGEINAKLIFHVDASESMSLTFNDYKPTNWQLAGKLGGNGFGASGIVVNTTNLNAQSDVNMNAELTGEVRVRFRSDYFPLERFADSQAIQLISSNAKVLTAGAQYAPPAAPVAAVPGAVPGIAPPAPPPLPAQPGIGPMPPSGPQGLPRGGPQR